MNNEELLEAILSFGGDICHADNHIVRLTVGRFYNGEVEITIERPINYYQLMNNIFAELIDLGMKVGKNETRNEIKSALGIY